MTVALPTKAPKRAGAPLLQRHRPPMPHPDDAVLAGGALPYRYLPDFMTDPEWRQKVVEFADAWAENHPKRLNSYHGRINSGVWDPQLAQDLWDALVGDDPERIDALRLPTRPGWVPIAFSPYLLPCVYLRKGAEFGIHLDPPTHYDPETGDWIPANYDTGFEGPTNWGKLVLYPLDDVQGGDLAFYHRDPVKEAEHQRRRRARKAGEPRIPPLKPREMVRLELEPGSAVLFDMWYPHASLPLESDRKIAMGVRVMYVREK